MTTSDAIWLSGITAFASVATATVNMIGSVLILYIRAKYNYTEPATPQLVPDGIRDVPIAGPKQQDRPAK